jgi:hypothetical protein
MMISNTSYGNSFDRFRKEAWDIAEALIRKSELMIISEFELAESNQFFGNSSFFLLKRWSRELCEAF